MHGVRVRGRVTPPSGSGSPPLFQMVTLAPIGQHDASGQPHMSLIRDSKGEFEFRDVLPGEYRLQVMAGGVDQSNRMSAERMVDVGDQDIEGLQLTPGSPQTLNGQVIVPEGRKLPAGLVVMLGSREAGDTRGGGMAQVGGDGAFRIPDVASGDYDVLLASSSGTDDDSYIDTIRMGDRDALAEGVHVGEGQLPPLHIVLKPNGGAAECMVKDDQGDPVPDALVFAAPDAPKQRQAALYGECRAEADGTCKILGITPGDYHLYAFPPGTEIDYRDPDALKPFEKYSEAMKFAEGERKPVNLKTAPVE
jgi:hypothetical protein